MRAATYIARLIAAIILLQTLFFKFSGHPDSVALFTILGAEPYGRIGLGVVELVAALWLLAPRRSDLNLYGALLSTGLMVGALLAHVVVLGIHFRGDNGTLFYLAVATMLSALFVTLSTYLSFQKIEFSCRPWLLRLFTPSNS